MGCKVITTTTSMKVKKAKMLNPDLIIDRSKEDILDKVLSYAKDGVDAVIDHVGSSTFNTSIQALRIGGRLASCGATSGEEVNINIRQLYNKRLSIYGAYLGDKKQLLDMLEFMHEHGIKPIIDSMYRLDEVSKAHKRIEDSKHFGKIVLRIG